MTLTQPAPSVQDEPRDDTPLARRRTPRMQLSAAQLIASALAAVSATIAASYLGVSGTVIGAAVASVVTVVGNAVYGHWFQRTGERVRDVVPVRWISRADGAPEPVVDPTPPSAPRAAWKRVGIACLALFAVLNVVITGVELAAGKPISDVLRGKSGSGTTLFGGATHASSVQTPTPTVTVTASVVVQTPTVTTTAPAVTQTVTPTVTATATPTPSSTTTPAAPTPTPSLTTSP